eukprot:m.306940 g.306940  ORF g.306940 m.306940 type:complete len:348 (-) comp16356_c0_seq9:1721-2764(-)
MSMLRPLQDRFGATPVFYASNIDVIKCLVDAGADLSHRTKSLRTMLHVATQLPPEDWVDFATMLLRLPIDVNAQDSHGISPLHCAVGNKGAPAVVEWLVANGADPYLSSNESSTPLDKANQECKDAIANGAKSRSLGAGGTIELAEILWSPETAEAQMILTALENSISVSELDLSGARLGHDGCIRLADFLGKDRTIEVLRISSVTLPDKSLSVDASTAFGEMLKVNTRLRALRFDSEGSEVELPIARALEQNTTLSLLRIDNPTHYYTVPQCSVLVEWVNRSLFVQGKLSMEFVESLVPRLVRSEGLIALRFVMYISRLVFDTSSLSGTQRTVLTAVVDSTGVSRH